ncbi:hypothetical protein M404DRAFT_120028 [Pisolithus tinctorius Marx 270]|uniref:Uncharacterized protein n=1 Tax=Pisolithus tinctorius Marx 270 TaxID=870435 RepID=A0A0C3K015_PISTI|nr:hypothetical protein M404DRAFT_120028 [Pisolithus tinctorius Marx 270]
MRRVQDVHNNGNLTHDALGGTAAYEAVKAYENHKAKNGEPDNHATAKELLAGFAGAFIDREFETEGLDYLDKQKAKNHGKHSLSCTSLNLFLFLFFNMIVNNYTTSSLALWLLMELYPVIQV